MYVLNAMVSFSRRFLNGVLFIPEPTTSQCLFYWFLNCTLCLQSSEVSLCVPLTTKHQSNKTKHIKVSWDSAWFQHASLTNQGRMTPICVIKCHIASDNAQGTRSVLSQTELIPAYCWLDSYKLIHFGKIWIKTQRFSVNNMFLKNAVGKIVSIFARWQYVQHLPGWIIPPAPTLGFIELHVWWKQLLVIDGNEYIW